MLAGFAFAQLTTPMPDPQPPFSLELAYLFLTCVAVGLELSAIILSTFLSTWAPSLALRGKMGSADLHKAVDTLRDYQASVAHPPLNRSKPFAMFWGPALEAQPIQGRSGVGGKAGPKSEGGAHQCGRNRSRDEHRCRWRHFVAKLGSAAS